MEIKPCPFCGAALEEEDSCPGWLWHPDNGCILADASVDLDGQKKLCIAKDNLEQIMKWNTRVNK